jgi:hypothetical protein
MELISIHHLFGEIGYLIIVMGVAHLSSTIGARREAVLRFRERERARLKRKEERMIARRNKLASAHRKKEETFRQRLGAALEIEARIKKEQEQLSKASKFQQELYDKHINYPYRIPNEKAYEEELAHYERLICIPKNERPLLHGTFVLLSGLRLNRIRKKRSY